MVVNLNWFSFSFFPFLMPCNKFQEENIYAVLYKMSIDCSVCPSVAHRNACDGFRAPSQFIHIILLHYNLKGHFLYVMYMFFKIFCFAFFLSLNEYSNCYFNCWTSFDEWVKERGEREIRKKKLKIWFMIHYINIIYAIWCGVYHNRLIDQIVLIDDQGHYEKLN